ncbi:electron transport complex subunit RsxC [bacterium endosymbiont of Bathymodiolus sp. 5 South]|uniref:electron transport complex subunit RsxC n=1 Tax=bacterium endosymbiont of Bathymodiolus sp. 5 South TaxID=1181670 RepID=UPI0010B678CD|nr:electron transport complex subunit RsxC [bacterium endosymbiont of Bathymodiolus sp. 5 South]SSC07801.1 Electron transport complex protein RnfC [bacterium endosymbiont of Bathymodiolus sp. 5 South]
MASYAFKGGVRIPNPYPIKKPEVKQVAPPEQAALFLQQRAGGEQKPCVKVGDKVLTGQVIAKTSGKYPSYTHASISGVVLAIEKRPIPHPSGIDGVCIVIDSDGKDKWIEIEKCDQDFLRCAPSKVIQRIREAGIVGMGGAGFPTHAKISNAQGAQTLIVNATECEPGIMCDDALMQHYPREIIRGVEVLMHGCGAKKSIIAIEDDKQEAFNSLLMYNFNAHIEIVQIPTKYTSGAEKILIKTLLDIEIPSGEFASDYGVLCQNVGTVKAIYDAVIDNKPLISRIVTVTGSAVKEPRNYEARLGASFASVAAQSKPNNKVHQIRMGGMMMGVDVPNIEHSIGKITNCIFVNNATLKPSVQSCIRCGQCNEVCPVGLLPQQLFWYAKSENMDRAMDYNLRDCIECRCCDIVCPSHIPLAQYFSFAKALHYKQTKEQQKADVARERFEFKEFRVERNKAERSEMMARKKEELKKKMAEDKTQKDKIAQAVARVKNKGVLKK